MNTHVFDADQAWSLDNAIRFFIHRPKKMFKGLIKTGDTVLDVGCGPGTFSIEMAKMVGPTGKIVAADLQTEMLKKARNKAARFGVANRIEFHKCEPSSIGLQGSFSLILAFYMVHEVPSIDTFMKEISGLLKPGGRFFMVEPLFHASRQLIEEEVNLAEKHGLHVRERRNVFLGKGFIMTNQ